MRHSFPLSKHLLLLTTALLSLPLTGCGVMYESRRAELLESASPEDYGPPPPEDHQEIGEQMIRAALKDPDSAKFQWADPRRDIIQQGFASPTPALVWLAPVKVNAKNGFGGYTGFKQYCFAWKDGALFAYLFASTGWNYVK